jgi:beta-galactosidase
VRRREFLRLSALAPLGALSLRVDAATAAPTHAELVPDGRVHRFALGKREFLLDGRPFQIRSGEMHPIRVPAEYWTQRIRMVKAMGLNTVAIYLMWNALEKEPGVFDLESGNRDFVRFIKLCQQEGMWVYLRPGPYVCAEWDFGGLPPYLLREPDIRVRHKDDPHYMQAVTRYLDAIAPHIAPLMADKGGPILMVQVENEYASFGGDLAYLQRIQAMWRERGIEGPFSISDGLGTIQKQQTYLPGSALGLDGDTDFAAAQAIAGEAPVWVGEGYPGWLTHWGDKDFQRGDYAATLKKLMAEGRSFNLYVAHGGSNFGFGAGANADADYGKFDPVITSYDYGAPIDERGAATADYRAFRRIIGEKLAHSLPAIPAAPPAMGFAKFELQPYASLWENLTPAKALDKGPVANELLFGQDHGMVLYRAMSPKGGRLSVEGVRDYATVFGAGRYLGYISRVRKPGLSEATYVEVPAPHAQDGDAIEILVDSFGHVGYGQAMADRKGIVGEIRLDGEVLQHWSAHGFPLDDAYLAGLRPLARKPERPGLFFKGTLTLAKTADTYLDMSAWDKGYVWVNGHLLGRHWRIGPQQRLFCPASWLKAGENEVLVFDMHRVEAAAVEGFEHLHE